MDNKKKEIEEMENEEDEIVQLFDDDGKPADFYSLGSMEIDGQMYAFFESVDQPVDEEDEIVIFKVDAIDGDSDQVALLPIEDEEELNRVYNIFVDEYNKEFSEDK